MDAVWEIEHDFNSPSPDPAPARGDASSKRALEERESLPWDIELDKGAALPAEIEISSDYTDEDIAPALRAKRRRA